MTGGVGIGGVGIGGVEIGAVVEGVDIGALEPPVEVEPVAGLAAGVVIGARGTTGLTTGFVAGVALAPLCGFAGMVNFVPTTRFAGSSPMTFLLAS